MASSQKPQDFREAQLTLLSQILHDGRRYIVSYKPEVKYLIEYQVQCLITRYSTLSIKYEAYMYTDGMTIGMIRAAGTIPIVYNQAQYNIPVVLWISERYPERAPFVYVTPTPGMVLKENHSCVDSNGLVQLENIVNWNERVDLVTVIEEMGKIFGHEPPLFAKVYQTQSSPMQATYNAQASTSQRYGFQRPVLYGAKPDPRTTYPSSEPLPQATPLAATRPSEPSADVTSPDSRYRKAVIAALASRAAVSIENLLEAERSKIAKVKAEGDMLLQRAQQIQAGISMLQNDREKYERNVQVMSAVVDEIANWSSATTLSPEALRDGVDGECVVVPQDPLAAQYLTARAEDLAAEETLTELDQQFESERFDLETYLKQIRRVCRQQYHFRAMSMKITDLTRRQ